MRMKSDVIMTVKDTGAKIEGRFLVVYIIFSKLTLPGKWTSKR